MAGAGGAWWLLSLWERGGGPALLAAAVAALLPGFVAWWRAPQSRQAMALPARGPSNAERMGAMFGVGAAACGVAAFLAWFCSGTPGDAVRDVSAWLGFRQQIEETEAMPQADEGTHIENWDERRIPRSRSEGTPDGPHLWLGSPDRKIIDDARTNGVYLALAAYDVYDAATETWSAFPVEPARLEADESGWVWLDARRPDAADTEAYFVRASSITTTVPWLPGTFATRATRVNLAGEGRWLLDPPGADTFQLLRKRDAFQDATHNTDRSRWLTLPAGREDFWITLAEETRGMQDASQSPQDVVRWLVSLCGYAAEFEWNGDGPMIEAFLNGETTGTCEHFATAATLMLRALGVPSRMVYGYAGGVLLDPPGLISFGPDDFHAWTEYWDPWQGWTLLETTLPGAGAAGPARQGEAEPLPVTEGDELYASAEGMEETNTSPRGLALVAALAGILALASWLAHGFRTGGLFARSFADGLGTGNTTAQPAYYRVFLARCRKLGLPRPQGATAGEHVNNLPATLKSHETVIRMRDYYYATRYAGDPQDAVTEQALRRAIADLPAPE